LPVPVSPLIKTVLSLADTRCITPNIRCIASL
jgi:hypothetical protein